MGQLTGFMDLTTTGGSIASFSSDAEGTRTIATMVSSSTHVQTATLDLGYVF